PVTYQPSLHDALPISKQIDPLSSAASTSTSSAYPPLPSKSRPSSTTNPPTPTKISSKSFSPRLILASAWPSTGSTWCALPIRSRSEEHTSELQSRSDL